MTNKPIAVIDLDYIKYAVGSVGEKRHIEVFNEAGQLIGDWKTRTEFKTECKASNLEYSDYTIVDIQTPEPLANVLHSAKSMVHQAIKLSGCDSYVGYLGRGQSFRVERSTLLEYKGSRKKSIKPLWLGEIEQYLVKQFGAIYVEGIEADDQCVIDCYGNNNVLVFVDKDYYGCGIQGINVNKPDEGIVNCNRFGKLWRDDKGTVRGYGRLFFYFQIASGDTADCYKANCMSDIKWGEVAAYNALKDTTNDREALTALVGVYKFLYPEPKTVTGWRGDMIEIDWMYCLSENWELCRMLRSMDELTNVITAKSVLDKLGVPYE